MSPVFERRQQPAVRRGRLRRGRHHLHLSIIEHIHTRRLPDRMWASTIIRRSHYLIFIVILLAVFFLLLLLLCVPCLSLWYISFGLLTWMVTKSTDYINRRRYCFHGINPNVCVYVVHQTPTISTHSTGHVLSVAFVEWRKMWTKSKAEPNDGSKDSISHQRFITNFKPTLYLLFTLLDVCVCVCACDGIAHLLSTAKPMCNFICGVREKEKNIEFIIECLLFQNVTYCNLRLPGQKPAGSAWVVRECR